jgi:hypothetical protein
VVAVLSGEGCRCRKTAIELPAIVCAGIIPTAVCARIISVVRFLEVSSASFSGEDLVIEDRGSGVVNRGGIGADGFSGVVTAARRGVVGAGISSGIFGGFAGCGARTSGILGFGRNLPSGPLRLVADLFPWLFPLLPICFGGIKKG